ncbi:hypothetical protein D3S22_24570 [Salmonella enterica]|nr:hypothetical protein [Salmonella enterica]EBM2642198.1 hypothetical protein [Salmonella enterica]EBN9575659.1 hypothetical protein [Salmonella enterica]
MRACNTFLTEAANDLQSCPRRMEMQAPEHTPGQGTHPWKVRQTGLAICGNGCMNSCAESYDPVK